MSDEVFILRANAPLEPEQCYYAIPGLKSELLEPMGKLIPTDVSIASRTLEWVIPNTPYNRAWVIRHYPHFKVLKLEERQEISLVEKPEMNLQEGKPDDPEVPEAGAEDFFAVPGNPVEIKTLKSKIMGKLTELGIPAPKNSTLSTLQELLKDILK